jgi:hypothetical protein
MLRFLFSLVLAVILVVVTGVVALLVLGDDDDSDSGTATGAVATPVSTRVTTSSASTSGSTTGGASPADDLLERATDAVAEITSFHFKLTHENGSTPLPLSLQLIAAEGDVIVPGSMKADVDAKAAGINVSVDVIGIDDETWITNPFTRTWQKLSGTNIRDFADPAALVESLLPSLEAESITEGGTVDGVATQLVVGTIDSGALSDALGIAQPGRTVTVEAWIGTDDHLPRKVRLAGALSDDDDEDVVRQVEISRYDVPVEIMPPE